MSSKVRITLPGKIQLWVWATTKKLSTNYPVRFYYKMLKKKVIHDAQMQPESMGDMFSMTFKDDGIKYDILVKRKY